MSREELAFWVAVVANGVTFVQIVPQIARLIRTGHTKGVSPTWAAAGMTINLGWLTYVVENQFWETIPSIIAAISSFGLALYLLHRNGANVRVGLLVSAAVAVASVGIQQAAGWTVLGTVLGLSNGLYLGPALIAAWREYAPVGVSPGTWWLTVLEGFKWGLYGVLVAAVPIVVYGSTAMLLAAGVLLRLWMTRDRIRGL
ncbi:MAG: hypothetical protein J4F50_11975 [Acidimicrobiia bacterium]|nr:hypothetical protein [Acidimicrobiia bacterium]